MPTALVVTTAGTNCDLELAQAFADAGASPESVHLNRLVREPTLVDRFDLIGLPGGFSYGDAVAAGRIAAALMREHLYPAFVEAVRRGVPIIAPCNGFQVAVQLGLLPGPPIGDDWSATAPAPTVALSRNTGGLFIDDWTRVEVPVNTRCIWTQGLDLTEANSVLPIAHVEGRFVAGDEDMLETLAENGQVAVRYAADDNPNGSMGAVAGICDASGLVFGLMPHPERYTRWTHHPQWTRLSSQETQKEPPGLTMFKNAVRQANQMRNMEMQK